MFVLGLTGSLGSGKTTVARLMAEHGARVIDADALAREALEPGRPAYEETVRRFGPECLKPDGSIDRQALGERVFNSPEERRRLEEIVHPRVREAERAAIRNASPGEAIVLDVPLLFESGMDAECDETCVVTIDEERRFERLRARGVSEDEAKRRLAAQMPQEEKIRRADHTIDNSGDLEQTRRAVAELMKHIQTCATREGRKRSQ